MKSSTRHLLILAVAEILSSFGQTVIASPPASRVDQAAIRASLEAMVAACNQEDLEAYAGGFDPHRRDAVMRYAGVLFAQHAVHMELEDAHVISAKRDQCDVAVKYTVSLTQHEFKIVAIVHMKKTHGDWVVSRESIVSFEEPRRAASSCMGGSCGRLGGGCPLRSSCSSGGCASGAR